MLEQIREITYRGSLKSCNYTCSYCPFGKKNHTPQALNLDREAWERFCGRLSDIRFLKPLKLLIAPYGEALIHRHYRESLAELSRQPYIGKVGCQTNLSFPAEAFLKELKAGGADMEKICLWATFHPEMVEAETFIRQVEGLAREIPMSVGVVGDPANLAVIQNLREKLPPWVYLWVNAMDGLGRSYTQEEISCFQAVDPMFYWEIGRRKGNGCAGGKHHVFVTADGSLYPCNRMPRRMGNFYECETKGLPAGPECSGRRCDCYLAYSHTSDFMRQAFWGDGHLQRVPERRKLSALFFDVDGTLIGRDGKIHAETKRALKYLAGRTSLFFATELPMDLALRKCGSIRGLFSGGCFAGGAHIVCWEDGFEEVVPLPALPKEVMEKALFMERRHGITCRILLPGVDLESNKFEIRRQTGGYVSVVKRGINKGRGVRTLCEHMGISMSRVMAVGNDPGDAAMLRECGYKAAISGSPQVTDEADLGVDFHLKVHQLAYIV